MRDGPFYDRSMDTLLRTAVEAALGSSVIDAGAISGGDFASSYRVALEDGRVVFAKTHADPPEGFFVTEAAGLRWLRDAAEISVPEVIAVTDGSSTAPALLVLQWIDEDRGTAPDDSAFGRSLARLHRAAPARFGREDRRPTGSRSLPNDPADTWPEFYAERRLLPLARIARDEGAVDTGVLGDVERIAGRLADWGAADEPPARLHGDLWAGNRVVDRTGSSWLVDPAAHGGHREFDLAMMRLFGGFGSDAFSAYHHEFPLADEWERRVPLHQLAPLLVHAVKFGGSYPAAVARAVATILSARR
jgi:fructosamine-3-kinase